MHTTHQFADRESGNDGPAPLPDLEADAIALSHALANDDGGEDVHHVVRGERKRKTGGPVQASRLHVAALC